MISVTEYTAALSSRVPPNSSSPLSGRGVMKKHSTGWSDVFLDFSREARGPLRNSGKILGGPLV